ncbi:MAG: TmcC family electron transfer complex membrane anchor subunit [Oceanidesulfovibrio sp.]
MHDLYAFLVGPLTWASIIIFIGGLVWRFVALTRLVRKKDPYVMHYLKAKWTLRSWVAWLIPFYPRSMRMHPWYAGFGYIFHIGVILVPIFLLAHVVLWEEGALGISLWTMPEWLADVLTVAVLAACVFFALRRMRMNEVKYVTDWTDHAILVLVALPFLTGILAHYQIFDYKFMIIFHILAGQAALIILPFTRVGHMIYGPMLRAYMGSEFGGVRHTKDW